jgi:hypothetical protein
MKMVCFIKYCQVIFDFKSCAKDNWITNPVERLISNQMQMANGMQFRLSC